VQMTLLVPTMPYAIIQKAASLVNALQDSGVMDTNAVSIYVL